jgi:hypothetical protein
MKRIILTLVLGVAAAASAQTKGDPQCADLPAGNYWMAVTQDSGYCTSPPAASAQTSRGGDAQCASSTYGKCSVATTDRGYCASSPATPSASAQPSNWLDAACPNKEPVEAWRQCAMAAVSAKAEARENTFNEKAAQQKFQQQQAEYQRQLLQLASRLNYDPDSPFKGKIKTPTNSDGVVQDNSVLMMLENSLSDGILYRYRDADSGSGDVDAMLETVKGFWSAAAEIFKEASSLPPARSRLVYGAGIVSIGFVMDAIVDRYHEQRVGSRDAFFADLRPLAKVCR